MRQAPSDKAYPVVLPNDDVNGLVIFLTAISSDNPTVESAWDSLCAAVTLAEGESLARRRELVNHERDNYMRLLLDMETLKQLRHDARLRAAGERDFRRWPYEPVSDVSEETDQGGEGAGLPLMQEPKTERRANPEGVFRRLTRPLWG